MTFNTRLAQELAKWAEGQGRGDEYHRALFRACFVDGTNIGKKDELLSVVTSLGLSRDEALRVIEERTYSGAVDADWKRSRELGIRGVPTFLTSVSRVVGAQPYEILERLVRESGGVKRRS
jgi:predicted DsbA family dithiol-disulfide isomerase